MSSTPTPTVFVTGATGTQGSTVARHVRTDLGWAVHATARNPSAPIVHSLQALGDVTFTPGDWSDEAALTAAMAGCTHLFLNLIPNMADFSSEVPHARRILRIAKAAGVKHVIYSSSLSLKDRTLAGVDLDSLPVKAVSWKREIEGLVRNGGFDAWTILRPAFFMSNILAPNVAMYPDLTTTNVWTTAYTADTLLPLCDPEDIGPFAAAAFADPGRFHGKEVVIASEIRTPEEVMRELSRANGRDMRCRFLTDEEVAEQRKTNLFVTSQLMSREMSKSVNMDEAKSWGITLGGFKEFLERQKKAVKDTYP